MKKEYYYGILPLALTSCLVSQTSAQERQINRPNVVFIYADDIGYGDLSCNGAKTIHTPNVERLAKMGVRFTNAHSAAATSTPSRYAMLTGEYAWRKEGTGIADGDAASIIRPERYTMADMFKEAGYSTGVVGKWHLGLGDKGGEQDWNKPLKPGTNDIGFDYSFIMAATGDRVPCVFVENDRVINLDPNDPIQVSYKKNFPGEPTGKDNPELLKMHPSHGHNQSIVNGISRIGYMKGGKSALWQDEDIADIITDKAKNFIASHQEEPFFLYMGTQDVHVPRIPHPRFAGKSGLGTRGDVILQLDWTIGEIMNTLDSLNIADNTILVFTSDNGPVIDDGYQDHAYELLNGHTPMGIYRGGKYSAYEAGTRIPFIVRWPAKVKPSKQQSLFSQIDVYASLASLLNQPLRKGAAPDSQEHLNTFLGRNNTGREYIVQQNLNNTLAIVKGQWKYIEPSDAPAIEFWTKMELGNDQQPQLYDLSSDPSEKTNVAKQHPDIVKELAELLESVKEK